MRGIDRVHWHWTAGAPGQTEHEHDSYNELIQPDGSWAAGEFSAEAQIAPIRPGAYAAHTLGANTGAVGLACDAMAGMTDSPFNWGSNPLTEAAVHTMLVRTAFYCKKFGITPSRKTTLSHAEVERNLGIKQRGKIDFTVLPGMTRVDDPVVVGDELRRRLGLLLDGGADAPDPSPLSEIKSRITLSEPTPPARPLDRAFFTQTLRSGNAGPAVLRLQEVLKTAGFYKGRLDGMFGLETKSAVVDFQTRSGLVADGVYGPKTAAALQELVAA